MLSKKTVLAAITRFPDLSDVLAVVMIGGEQPHNAPSSERPGTVSSHGHKAISAGSHYCPARDWNKVRLVMSLDRIKTDQAVGH